MVQIFDENVKYTPHFGTSSGVVFRGDCVSVMKHLKDNSVDLMLTDIPYEMNNRKGGGLREIQKGVADVLTFDLQSFLEESMRVSKGTQIVFCGKNQFSDIYNFYLNQKGTTRVLVWEKSNPSPMNGQLIYLSGVELAVWFKPRGHKTFNAHCKNTVFKHPNGSSKLHPTEKNHKLLEELILDNSNEGDIVLDACAGSGSTLLVAEKLGRKYIGVELDVDFYDVIQKRLGDEEED